MRKLLSSVALFALLGSTAIAGPQEDALQVVEKWAKAFTDSDVDTIVKLHSPDALFVGTGSRRLLSRRRGSVSTSSRHS